MHAQCVELWFSGVSLTLFLSRLLTRNMSLITSDGPHLDTHTYTRKSGIYERNSILECGYYKNYMTICPLSRGQQVNPIRASFEKSSGSKKSLLARGHVWVWDPPIFTSWHYICLLASFLPHQDSLYSTNHIIIPPIDPNDYSICLWMLLGFCIC